MAVGDLVDDLDVVGEHGVQLLERRQGVLREGKSNRRIK
jgi:hypothetical protein